MRLLSETFLLNHSQDWLYKTHQAKAVVKILIPRHYLQMNELEFPREGPRNLYLEINALVDQELIQVRVPGERLFVCFCVCQNLVANHMSSHENFNSFIQSSFIRYQCLACRKHLRTISWKENEMKPALDYHNCPDAVERSLLWEPGWRDCTPILLLPSWAASEIQFSHLYKEKQYLHHGAVSFTHLFLQSIKYLLHFRIEPRHRWYRNEWDAVIAMKNDFSLPRTENSRKTSTSASLTTLKPLTVWITTNWKILQKMGIPDQLNCLLRNLYAGQDSTVRTRYVTTDWSQIGKWVHQGCILSPRLFNFYAEYIMRNAGLDKAQARIKMAGRNINNIRYADNTTLMAESKVELKSLLIKVKEKSENTGLKLNIQKTKIIVSSPITSWQMDGGAGNGNSGRFYFLGLQNHCGWWLQPWN